MRHYLKKLATLALSAALLAGSALAITPEEAFPDQYEYPGFIDVADGAWYADAARVCATAGLMQGTGQAFAPDELLSAMPRTLIISAGQCDLRFEDERFGMKLVSLGVEVTMRRVPGAKHGFIPHFMEHWREGAGLIVSMLRNSR